MSRSPGRSGSAWRQAHAWILAHRTHCSWCGAQVDKTLSGRHPWGPSVDHIVKLEDGGDPIALSNLDLMHLRCNTAKENHIRAERKRLAQGTSSRDW